MKRSISEILAIVEATPGKKEKSQILREMANIPTQKLLRYALHPQIIWHLPEGRINYRPWVHSDDDSHLVLISEVRLFNNFATNLADPKEKISMILPFTDDTDEKRAAKEKKRLKIFIDLLERVTPGDAELLLSVKDKKLPYKTITRDVINGAFPQLV